MDVGETLREAVMREVEEEAGKCSLQPGGAEQTCSALSAARASTLAIGSCTGRGNVYIDGEEKDLGSYRPGCQPHEHLGGTALLRQGLVSAAIAGGHGRLCFFSSLHAAACMQAAHTC